MMNPYRKILSWLHDDRRLLYITVALIVVSGLVRIVDYGLSLWFFNGAFLPYFVMRGWFYYGLLRRRWSAAERYRGIAGLALFAIVVFNAFTPYPTEFLPLLLLLIDYLLVVNNDRE
jgi:hypothetical protein